MLILDYVKNTLSHYGKEHIPAFVIKEVLFHRRQFYRNNFFNLNDRLPARYMGKKMKPFYVYQDIYDYFKKKSDSNPNYTIDNFNAESAGDGMCRACGKEKDLNYIGRPPLYCSIECAVRDAYVIIGECYIPRMKKVFHKRDFVNLELGLYNTANNTSHNKKQSIISRNCKTVNCINPKHLTVSLKKNTNIFMEPVEDNIVQAAIPLDPNPSDVLKIGNNTYNYGIDVTQSREKFNDFLNKISRTYKHEIRCEVTKSIIQIISIKCLNNDYTDMDKYLKLLTDFDESHVV